MADFDLTRSSHPRLPAATVIDCARAGTLDALAVWFEADLGSENVLSTDPAQFRPDNHWTHPVYLLADPIQVQVGNRIRLRIDTSHSVQVSAEHVEP